MFKLFCKHKSMCLSPELKNNLGDLGRRRRSRRAPVAPAPTSLVGRRGPQERFVAHLAALLFSMIFPMVFSIDF